MSTERKKERKREKNKCDLVSGCTRRLINVVTPYWIELDFVKIVDALLQSHLL